jgi:hypothetical protein
MLDKDDLGPLPQADRNSVLQQESIRALQAALPPDRFVFRPEGTIDAGVDASLELLIESQYTNLRAQVQLKATDSAETRTDGSVAYRVKVSNLNYLLNGPSPLYVLYVAPLQELRFAWARDERNRIERENPDWMDQSTITLSFSKLIDEQGIAEIHNRIRGEAVIDRRSRDGLSRIGVSERVTIRIDSGTLEVSEPDRIRELLLQGGYHFVSNGFGPRVLELVDELRLADRQVPKIALVAAFAEHHRGRYDLALGHLTNASLGSAELSDDDRLFLDVLRDDCDLRTGRIKTAEFIERQKALSERGTGEFYEARRLDYLRQALRDEDQPERQQEIADQVIATVTQALSADDSSDVFKVQAHICQVDAEGVRLVRQHGRGLGLIRTRMAMGMPTDSVAISNRFNSNLQAWIDLANRTAAEATRTGNPQLVGDAIIARANIMFVHFASVLLNAKIDSRDVDDEPIRSQLIPDVEQAIQLYVRSGNIDWQLQAKILLANFLDLTGRNDEATRIAAQVLPIAKALRLEKTVRDAEGYAKGLPFHRQKEAEFQYLRDQDPDVMMAAHDDEKLKTFARTALEAMSLPPSRLANVEKESLAAREIAREKLDWCRQIDLIQDLWHTLDPSTLHSIDPQRYCICLKHGYRSPAGSPDWRPLITSFKQVCCTLCPDRDPKGRGPTLPNHDPTEITNAGPAD